MIVFAMCGRVVSDHVFMAKYGNCMIIHYAIAKRVDHKRDAIVTYQHRPFLELLQSPVEYVYNEDRFIMQLAHRGVDLP
jgi:hypothetical protein